jgi:hypothetical protein
MDGTDRGHRGHCSVFQAWWIANGMYPDLPIGTRLSLAERAIRELLSEKLITLLEDESPANEIPAGQYDIVLKRWDTWVFSAQATRPQVYFTATEAGRAAKSRD